MCVLHAIADSSLLILPSLICSVQTAAKLPLLEQSAGSNAVTIDPEHHAQQTQRTLLRILIISHFLLRRIYRRFRRVNSTGLRKRRSNLQLIRLRSLHLQLLSTEKIPVS